MNKRQDGFGLIEAILVVIVVSVLGATTWYAFHTKHQTDQILDQADKISQNTPSPASSQNFLLIKEWNVKITFPEAAEVSYKTPACGSPNCSTDLVFKNTVTATVSCQPILEIIQENNGSLNPSPNKQIGKSNYGLIKTFNADIENGFNSCSKSVNDLRNAIRQAISLDSVTAL